LELEELSRGLRNDAPHFRQLCEFILATEVPPVPNAQVGMLADPRSYTVLRDAVTIKQLNPGSLAEFRKIIDKYVSDLMQGVNAAKREFIEDAKKFTMMLNESILSKEMDTIYRDREPVDGRYVNHESFV
jgi:hypothetical protein